MIERVETLFLKGQDVLDAFGNEIINLQSAEKSLFKMFNSKDLYGRHTEGALALAVCYYRADYYELSRAFLDTIPLLAQREFIVNKVSDLRKNWHNLRISMKDEEYIEIAKSLVEKYPDYWASYFNLGKTYYNNGGNNDGIEGIRDCYVKALELDPDNTLVKTTLNELDKGIAEDKSKDLAKFGAKGLRNLRIVK